MARCRRTLTQNVEHYLEKLMSEYFKLFGERSGKTKASCSIYNVSTLNISENVVDVKHLIHLCMGWGGVGL